MITEPKIYVWAETSINHIPQLENITDVDDIDFLHEAAGRSCYQSWSRPNADTRRNQDYLANIDKVRHYSVLAHGSVTLYVEGVSRSLTHELIRSRFLAFSQVSQRYVADEDLDWVCPPLYLGDKEKEEGIQHLWDRTMQSYRTLLAGKTKKVDKEAARAVLPNCTETKIVVTGNIRAWRDLISQRDSPGADAEVQRLAKQIKIILQNIAPNSMQGV